MEFVYAVPAAELEKLKKKLEKDPYAEDSFTRLGYVLKEAKSLGLDSSEYVLYFKADEAKGRKLLESLNDDVDEKFKAATQGREMPEEQKQKILEGIKAKQIGGRVVEGEEKDKVAAAIELEESQAAQGFGSIFG